MNVTALLSTTPIASSYAQQSGLSSSTDMPTLMGVAMRGNHTSEKETEANDIVPPSDYYEESFKLIHDAGLNHVRYLLYWESYVRNPSLFMQELATVADTADRWGIKVPV